MTLTDCALQDPVRKEVPDAVRTCHRAGILVRMVTGDNIHTARHIARECGILTEGGLALEGPKFREMPEEELLELLPRLQVSTLRCNLSTITVPQNFLSFATSNLLQHQVRCTGFLLSTTAYRFRDISQLCKLVLLVIVPWGGALHVVVLVIP